jgi:2-keto-3-deoxy-galactonokinase
MKTKQLFSVSLCALASLREILHSFTASDVMGRGPIQRDRTTPNDEHAIFLQRMEDSRLRQLWRLTNVLFKVRNGALIHKDVTNEDRPDYVYENKGVSDTMTDN